MQDLFQASALRLTRHRSTASSVASYCKLSPSASISLLPRSQSALRPKMPNMIQSFDAAAPISVPRILSMLPHHLRPVRSDELRTFASALALKIQSKAHPASPQPRGYLSGDLPCLLRFPVQAVYVLLHIGTPRPRNMNPGKGQKLSSNPKVCGEIYTTCIWGKSRAIYSTESTPCILRNATLSSSNNVFSVSRSLVCGEPTAIEASE